MGNGIIGSCVWVWPKTERCGLAFRTWLQINVVLLHVTHLYCFQLNVILYQKNDELSESSLCGVTQAEARAK